MFIRQKKKEKKTSFVARVVGTARAKVADNRSRAPAAACLPSSSRSSRGRPAVVVVVMTIRPRRRRDDNDERPRQSSADTIIIIVLWVTFSYYTVGTRKRSPSRFNVAIIIYRSSRTRIHCRASGGIGFSRCATRPRRRRRHGRRRRRRRTSNYVKGRTRSNNIAGLCVCILYVSYPYAFRL